MSDLTAAIRKRMALAYATTMLLAAAGPALSQPLKKVTLVHTAQTRSQEAPAVYLPRAFGWWKDEGYDVDIVPASGSSSVTQLLIGGRAEAGLVNSGAIINAHLQGFPDIKIAAIVTNTIWRLGVLPGGGITSPAQLRGKTIGLIAVGAGGDAYLDDLLRRHGVDPKEITKVVVGRGVNAQEALRSGSIQGWFTIDAELDRFSERTGTKLEIFYEPEWLDFPDFGLSISSAAVKRDPNLAEALARGIAKAFIVQTTSPECVSKVYHALNGDTAGRGTMDMLNAQNSFYAKTLQTAFERGGAKYPAAVNVEGLDKLQQFLFRTKTIARMIPSQSLILDTDDFARRVNNFDRAKVEAQARDCTALPNLKRSP